MNLEEAITTAIEYETRVRDTYEDAMKAATDDSGRRVFETLRNEEQGHLNYLNSRLEEWRKTGKITVADLKSVIPSQESINEGIGILREKVSGEQSAKYDSELQMLRRALEVERETSRFYRKMVDTMGSEGHEMFRRFMEIEEGHQSIVQAEIDCVTGTGFWFDIPEFKLG